jgi:DNA-binding transcriptional regulator YiaG
MTDASATTRPPQRWTTVLDGDRLRQLRRQRDLSQEKLADLAGISSATVARLDSSVAHLAGAGPWAASPLPCTPNPQL